MSENSGEKKEGRSEEKAENEEAIIWVCSACDYNVEGNPPTRCPECGADEQEFEKLPIPGF